MQEYNIKIEEGDPADCIANMLPCGSVVAVTADNEDIAREYIKKLRRVKIVARFVRAQTTQEYINSCAVEPDVRLIVAVGGEREADFAKLLGKHSGLPVFVIVTTPAAVTVLDKYCAVYSGNVLSLHEGTIPTGVCIAEETDDNRDDLPAALGGICCAALGVFDCEAYRLSVGKQTDKRVREQAYSYIYEALDIAAKGRRNIGLPRELCRISLKLAELSCGSGCGFVRGAADDCARAAIMLFTYESRKLLSRGEFAFMFGSVLCRMYREFLSAPSGFYPPPDYNLRAEKLCDYLGFDEFTAARAAVKRLCETELTAYRVGEYRDELSSLASDAVQVFGEANKLFKRMYADDGFSVRDIADKSDVKCIISLAPDCFTVYGSFLMIIRELGFLDKYL